MREDYLYPRYDMESPLAETREELDFLYNEITSKTINHTDEQQEPPLE